MSRTYAAGLHAIQQELPAVQEESAMPSSMIHVRRHDGHPARGVRVVLGFTWGHSEAVRTNENGEARIEHDTRGRATIFVDGREVASFETPGSASVTV